MNKHPTHKVVIPVILSCLCTLQQASANPITLVAPYGIQGSTGEAFTYADVKGNDSLMLFNDPGGTGETRRFQQIYDSSLFSGISGVVTDFAFRLDNKFTTDASYSADISVSFSHSRSTATILDTSWDGQLLSLDSPILVYDGLFEFSSNCEDRAGPTPCGFNVIFDVVDEFNYDGVSDLIIDITFHTYLTNGIFLDGVRTAGTGGTYPPLGSVATIWDPKNSGPRANDRGGLITKFGINTMPVPEAPSLMVFLFGLVTARFLFYRHQIHNPSLSLWRST